MKKNLIRTLIALTLSISGILFSIIFLKPDLNNQGNKKKLLPMAKVIFANNDVKKQGIDKLIWEPVQKGELLFLGEKLKTSTSSNAKIEFIENNAMIDVEAESLVVINKNNKKLSLQVVEGSLFVSSNKNNAELNVTSGNGIDNSINIKNGDVSYSVNKDGKANVDIIKGNVESKNKLDNTKFKDISPSFASQIFVDPALDDGIYFKWKPLGDEYTVRLELGNERNSLKKATDTSIDLGNGIAKSKIIIGTVYWRLVAQNIKNTDDKFSSSTFKVTYSQKMPPNPIYPIQNELVQLKNPNAPIDFKWNTVNNFDSISLEIFLEENKIIPVITEKIENQTFFQITKIQKPGKYFWKLTGKLNGSDAKLVSSNQYFQIIIGDDLQSPQTLKPEENSTVYSLSKNDNGAKNLLLNWLAIKEANQYLVSIKKESTVKEFKVNQTELTIPALNYGSYSWAVQSINEKKEISKKKTWHTFNIAPIEQLNFIDSKDKIYYYNQMPLYVFKWNSLSNTHNYRLKVSSSQSLNNAEVFTIKTTNFNYQIGKEGLFYAQVEGLDIKDNTMAKSDILSVQVSKSPPPPPPIFLENGKKIEANLNGDITFSLINFQPNLQVQFEIRDLKGALIESTKIKSAKGSFTSLEPGTFYVTAKYIDELGQTSEFSERKSFKVPENSAIAPPSTKGIRIR